MVRRVSRYNCVQCGACCCNPPANRAEGFTDYIEVDERAPLLKKPDLVRRMVVYAEDGTPHLRLHPDGRCLALRGRLGKHVQCTIYADRPLPCRKVEAGSALCQRYRAAHGLRA
jgi:Fe-S-cluster containining protein